MSMSGNLIGEDVINAYLDQFESQTTFRKLLDAFSRPGTIELFPRSVSERLPSGLIPLLAMLGHGSPFAVLGDSDTYWAALTTHTTGARAVNVGEASYVAVLGAATTSTFAEIPTGSNARPDFAAHVAIGIDGALVDSHEFDDEQANHLRLSLRGPGVPDERAICVVDPDAYLLDLLAARPQPGPCGFDIWILDPRGRLVGIPRSSSLHIGTHLEQAIGDQ